MNNDKLNNLRAALEGMVECAKAIESEEPVSRPKRRSVKQELKPNQTYFMTLSQVAHLFNMSKKTTLQTLKSIEHKTSIALLFKTGGKTSPWVISSFALAKANIIMKQPTRSN
jgi:hypothetical protein